MGGNRAHIRQSQYNNRWLLNLVRTAGSLDHLSNSASLVVRFSLGLPNLTVLVAVSELWCSVQMSCVLLVWSHVMDCTTHGLAL